MSISNAEWEIMRVVWTKEETTSSQILEILEQRQTGQPLLLRHC